MKAVDHTEDVLTMLSAHGFAPDGFTDTQTVRIPTVRAPVFGGIGGELATFGGRKRFKRDDLKVTVGKRTTYFYRVKNKRLDLDFGKSFKTKNVEAIHMFLESQQKEQSK